MPSITDIDLVPAEDSPELSDHDSDDDSPSLPKTTSRRRRKKQKARANDAVDVPITPSSLKEDTTSPPRRTHAQIGKAKRRAAKRARESNQQRDDPVPYYKVRSSLSLKNREMHVLKTQFNVVDLRHAKRDSIGTRQNIGIRHLSLEELLEQGYELVQWDGR